jgi:hypothetical protein
MAMLEWRSLKFGNGAFVNEDGGEYHCLQCVGAEPMPLLNKAGDISGCCSS